MDLFRLEAARGLRLSAFKARFRAAVQALVQALEARSEVYLAPRYDDVFDAGVRALDEEMGQWPERKA